MVSWSGRSAALSRDPDLDVLAGGGATVSVQCQFDAHRVLARIGDRVDAADRCLQQGVAVQLDIQDLAGLQGPAQAHRQVCLDLQCLGFTEVQQRLTRLHRIADLDMDLLDHARELRYTLGVAQQRLNLPHVRLRTLVARGGLGECGLCAHQVGGPFGPAVAHAHEALHRIGERLVHHRRHAHAARGTARGVGTRRVQLALQLHPGIADVCGGRIAAGDGGVEARQQGAVIEFDQHGAGVETVTFMAGDLRDAPRHLRGELQGFVGGHGAGEGNGQRDGLATDLVELVSSVRAVGGERLAKAHNQCGNHDGLDWLHFTDSRVWSETISYRSGRTGQVRRAYNKRSSATTWTGIRYLTLVKAL